MSKGSQLLMYHQSKAFVLIANKLFPVTAKKHPYVLYGRNRIDYNPLRFKPQVLDLIYWLFENGVDITKVLAKDEDYARNIVTEVLNKILEE